MRTSSPQQLNFDDQLSGASEQDASRTTSIGTDTKPPVSSGKVDLLNNSNFDFNASAYAATTRMAGRINAANIPQEEINELLRERQILVDKEIDRSITHKQENRLQYIRWTLDRVEDARYGFLLDKLETMVTGYEKFHSDIQALTDQLQQHVKRRK